MSAQVEPAVAPPPGNPRFPLVDALRAVAALSILMFHTAFLSGALGTEVAGRIAGRLEIGVAAFFAISGFLLYRPMYAARYHGHDPAPLSLYLWRRFLRIVPAYWVALTALAIWPGLPGLFKSDAWVYYGFGQVYERATYIGGMSQAWSLAVEVSFYAVLPLLALGLAWLSSAGRRPGRTALGILAMATASIAFRQWADGRDLVAGVTLLGYAHWFAPGMLLAVLSVVGPDRGPAAHFATLATRRPGLVWAGAGVVFAVLATVVPAPDLFSEYDPLPALVLSVLSPVFAALLLAPAVLGGGEGGWPRRLLARPAFAWLGLVSYGIFLWHVGLATALRGRAPIDEIGSVPLRWVALTALTVVGSVALAAVSYYALERPLLRFKGGRGRRAG